VQNPSITLIVSTYNQPDFLRLVLAGIANQKDQSFELMIADDGSNEETRERIDIFSTSHQIPTKHLWHEDDGFRKSTILNTAIQAANNDYLVFLDGDCIPRPQFIRDHRVLARERRIVGCSRVLVDQTLTQHALDNDLNLYQWSFFKLAQVRLSGHLNRVFPCIPLFLGPLRATTPHAWKRVRGCNFGIFRKDILEIGGFDESFTGWGYEDSELVARAINSGIFVRRGDHRATVMHLWHPEVSRDDAKSNRAQLEDTLITDRKMAISSSISS
jgi:glycosyltransferase involved in cell wall biosynthesis